MSQIFRYFSTSITRKAISKNALGGSNLVEKVAVSSNGRTIAAWHPDVDFPYENTKPIPKVSDVQSSLFIKEEMMKSTMGAFKGQKPEVEKLMALTYTTKHRWFPRSRDKRAKDTPMDRKYL